MGFQIEDGKGTGNLAEVNVKNLLQTHAVTETELVEEAENGNAYSWSNVSYDYAAGDTILLVRNESSTEKLHIDRMRIHGSTATEIVIHCPTVAFTPTGTAVTGVNLNRISGKTASATAKANETQNTQGDVIMRAAIAGSATNSERFDIGEAVILGNGQSIGVDFVSDGSACRVTILGHFAEIS